MQANPQTRSKDQCNVSFLGLVVSSVGVERWVKKLHVAVHQSALTSPSPLGLARAEVIHTVI